MNDLLYLVPGSGLVALLFVYLKNNWVASKDVGSEKMERIAKNIADGAMAFLRAEYRILAIFVFAVAVLLGVANSGRSDSSILISLSFIVGAIASGLAGFLATLSWFFAFTLIQASFVRAVGQIEIFFSYISSKYLFKEKITFIEILGILIFITGATLLLLTRTT